MVKESKIIEEVKAEIKKQFEGEGTGHDWWHIYRVWSIAKKIAQKNERQVIFGCFKGIQGRLRP